MRRLIKLHQEFREQNIDIDRLLSISEQVRCYARELKVGFEAQFPNIGAIGAVPMYHRVFGSTRCLAAETQIKETIKLRHGISDRQVEEAIRDIDQKLEARLGFLLDTAGL